MSFSRYGINNELNGTPKDTQDGKYLLNGIGLFCHEFSHTMGLPDHYPVSGSSTYADNQSPEYWDLMDAGEYTQDGYCPTPYTPWEKMMMGWIDPVTLSSTQAEQLTLEPYDMASKAYKIMADVDDSNFSSTRTTLPASSARQPDRTSRREHRENSCCCRISETKAGIRACRDMDCWFGA